MWSMLSDASTSRMALIGALRRGDAASLARVLAAEGLDRRWLPGERHVERRQYRCGGTA
jgi:hypothetical protein